MARVLEHAWPPAAVVPLIALSPFLLLGVDGLGKRWLRHRV